MLIVVGHTSRPESQAALEYATQEALAHSAQLHIVRVIGLPGETHGGIPDWAKSIKESRTLGEAIAAELVERGVESTFQVEPAKADAAAAIVNAASELSADIIVIGLRRRTKVGKMVLGSVAQDVLLAANCPVVAVKAAD